MEKPDTFKIQIDATVIFKDWHGTVLKVYNVGDIIDATYATHEANVYFVTSMGGIYKDEAHRI